MKEEYRLKKNKKIRNKLKKRFKININENFNTITL